MTIVISYLMPTFKGARLTRGFYLGWASLGLLLAFLFWLVFSLPTTVTIFRVYSLSTMLLCFVGPLVLAFGRGDRVSTWVSIALLGLMACTAAQVYSMYLSTPIDAYKQLFIDQDSAYYIPEGEDPNMFDVYNAFTQIITDGMKKDMIGHFEKTMIVGKLLGIVS